MLKKTQPTSYLSYIIITIMLLYFLFYSISYNTLIDGETKSTVNIAIEYMFHNKIHYPLHGQDHFLKDSDYLFTHPPLYYIFKGSYFKVFDFGVIQNNTFQFLLVSIFALLLIIGSYTLYNNNTMLICVALLTIFYGANYHIKLGRPDILLGIVTSIVTIIYTKSFNNPKNWHSFTAGILTVIGIASHWNGIYLFLFFPVYLLFASRKNFHLKRMIYIIVSFGFGLIFATLLWFITYGDKLYTILYHVYVEGAKRAHSLAHSGEIYRIFIPLYKWENGWLLIVGIILFIALSIIIFFRESKIENRDLILSILLIVYILFYIFVIYNRHYQYLSNVYFLIILIAARGYELGFRYLLESYGRRTLIVVLCSLSIYWTWSVYTKVESIFERGIRSNQYFETMRSNLRSYVNIDDKIFVGTGSYYLLFDNNDYVTNRSVEIEELSRRINKEDLWDLAIRQRLLNQHGDIVLVSDTSYMYEFKYYDEELWKDNYTKIGAVNGVVILFKNSIAEQLFLERGLSEFSGGCEDSVWHVTYGPGTDYEPGTNDFDWKKLNKTEKQKLIDDYLDRVNWFGQKERLQNDRKLYGRIERKLTKYFEIALDSDFRSQFDLKRSIDQAFDSLGAKVLFEC